MTMSPKEVSDLREKLMKMKGTLLKLAGDIESINLQLYGETIDWLERDR